MLPHYLAMGMPYDMYWEGECGCRKAYREAFRIRLENEERMADRINWYLGQYLLYVLNSTPLLVAGFNVKKGANLPEYPSKPFFEQLEERKKAEAKRKQEEDQTMLAMALFQAGIEKFNRRFTQEHPEAVSTGQ